MKVASPAWTVREVRPDDASRLADLFRSVFGFDRSVEHTAWKFGNNPAGAPVVVVAEDAGRLVGQYALLPTWLRLGSERVLGAQSLDTMTHADYRGQGMFVALANASFDVAVARGVQALYGFPNANSYGGFVRRLNWDHTGNVSLWARPLRPSAHRRVPRAVGPVADLVARIWPTGSRGSFEIITSPEAPHGVGELIGAWAAEKDLCRVDRDAHWVDWRYSHRSGAGYEWVGATRGGVLKAAVVWGRDIRNGNAVVAEFLGRDPDAMTAALATVVRRAREGGHPLAITVVQQPTAQVALRRCGFVRARGVPLIVRSMTSRTLGANIHDHAAWHVVGADLDTF